MPDPSQIIQSIKESVPVIANAWPSLTILAIVLMGGTWWLRGHLAKGQINGLKSQLDARDERLKLANEKFDRVAEEKARLEDDLAKLKKQIAASASLAALAGTSAAAESRVLRLGDLLGDLKGTLTVTGEHLSSLRRPLPDEWPPKRNPNTSKK